MITVNAMGDNCPIPVIKTKKAMQEITGPETIEVLVDNEIAVQNVTKMAVSSGGNVTSEKLGEKEFKVTIQMNGAVAKEAGEEAVCTPDRKGDTIVVIASDKMGSGNDELGKVLIKGFIFAVTQLVFQETDSWVAPVAVLAQQEQDERMQQQFLYRNIFLRSL